MADTEYSNPLKKENIQRRTIAGIIAAIGGMILIVGVLLPWIRTGQFNISGMNYLGWRAFILVTAGALCLISGIMGAIKKKTFVPIYVICIIAYGVYLSFEYRLLASQMRGVWAAEIGIGFWLCCIGVGLILAAAIVAYEKKAQKPGSSPEESANKVDPLLANVTSRIKLAVAGTLLLIGLILHNGDRIPGPFVVMGMVCILLGVIAIIKIRNHYWVFYIAGLGLLLIFYRNPQTPWKLSRYGLYIFVGGVVLLIFTFYGPTVKRKLKSLRSVSTLGTNAAPKPTAKQRLQELEDLKKDGLISEEEYQEKRKEVLGKL
jgi:hypothetical protein